MGTRFVAVVALTVLFFAVMILPANRSWANTIAFNRIAVRKITQSLPCSPPKLPLRADVPPVEVAYTRSSLPQTRKEWLALLATGPYHRVQRAGNVVLIRNTTFYEIRSANLQSQREVLDI